LPNTVRRRSRGPSGRSPWAAISSAARAVPGCRSAIPIPAASAASADNAAARAAALPRWPGLGRTGALGQPRDWDRRWLDLMHRPRRRRPRRIRRPVARQSRAPPRRSPRNDDPRGEASRGQFRVKCAADQRCRARHRTGEYGSINLKPCCRRDAQRFGGTREGGFGTVHAR